MKRVLYISNIEVPYRVRVFNELAKHCDLTVLYERESSTSRNKKWAKSQDAFYRKEYLNGFAVNSENSFSFKILRNVFADYDSVIVGCYNSPVQMFLTICLRLFKKPYIINIDGEIFARGKSVKSKLKQFFLRGADKYLAAGEESANSLREIVGDKEIIPYYFSSLSAEELKANADTLCKRDGSVLVVGQYLDVKGLDVALETAMMNGNVSYKFVGMGNKTDEFIKKYCPERQKNIEFIPFLQKKDLEKEYQKCSAFVLPSRQECWGLVINEAASFGTPIVSTYGSGAAVEFLLPEYACYLSKPGDPLSLYENISKVLAGDNYEYSEYLKNKSKKYCIENCVKAHLYALEIEEE